MLLFRLFLNVMYVFLLLQLQLLLCITVICACVIVVVGTIILLEFIVVEFIGRKNLYYSFITN